MSIFDRDPRWKPWADKFDVALDKLVKANPYSWLTLELVVDHQSWKKIEEIPMDPHFEMTLPQYFRGGMWKRIRMQRFRKVDREDPETEIFEFKILRKFEANY